MKPKYFSAAAADVDVVVVVVGCCSIRFFLISHLVPTHFVALVDTYLCIQASAFGSTPTGRMRMSRQTQIQYDAMRCVPRPHGNTT